MRFPRTRFAKGEEGSLFLLVRAHQERGLNVFTGVLAAAAAATTTSCFRHAVRCKIMALVTRTRPTSRQQLSTLAFLLCNRRRR